MTNDKRQIFLTILFTLFFIASLTFIGCASENNYIGPDLSENDTQTEDEGAFYPGGGGSTDICEEDEEGDCIDAEDFEGLISLSTTGIDFGINEFEAIDCQTIPIPGNLSYAAEIDKTQTSYIESEDEEDGKSYQFAFHTGNGSYTRSRIESSGELSVCYMREAKGTHTGQIKLVLNSGSASSAYAYVITTTGQTLDPLFTITAPVSGEIFYDCSNSTHPDCTTHHDGRDDAEGDYLVNAKGSINMGLTSIFENGTETDIIIDADGVKYKTNFDADGNFAKTIGLSQTQGVYNVTFSINTNKDTTLSKVIPVVVAGTPKLEIEVRDTSGIEIDTSDPTDTRNLVVGLRIPNLESSAADPDQNMAITLYDIQFNGEPLSDDAKIWYESGHAWCTGKDGDDSLEFIGFDTEITYCIELDPLGELQSGLNTITASAKNILGDVSASSNLILDNNKPIITITAPQNNELKEPGITSLKIEGTIKNFAPISINESAPSPADESETGSWCTPSSEDDSSCPASSVKLWFNVSTSGENTPINIYPKYADTYTTGTLSEINDAIVAQPSNASSCYTTHATETLFDGDAENTTKESDGSIVTTTTDSDGNTQIYTTDPQGNIALANGETINIVEEQNTTVTVTIDNNGDITSVVDDDTTDIITTHTTDAETGEITKTTEQRICNVPEASFSFTLNAPSDDHHGVINLYTNILQFQASSVSGHTTIKVVTFQTGETKEHSISYSDSNTLTASLTAGNLGQVINNYPACEETAANCASRTPVMLNVSEGILDRGTTQGNRIIMVIEEFLNNNIKFTDLAYGWPLPEDNNGNIDLLTKFKEQYKAETGNDFPKAFYNLDDDYQELFIYQGLHKSGMAEKRLALSNYRIYSTLKGNCEMGKNHLCFFEGSGDPSTVDGYNVAIDACGSTITSAFVPLKDFQHIVRGFDPDDDLHVLIPIYREWPEIANTDLNFDDHIEGKWHVDSVNLKAYGKIDIDACLIPADVTVESCADDISHAQTPALWGHMTAYNLAEGGLIGLTEFAGYELGFDDATIPMIWNVGKIRLKLNDVVQLKKTGPLDSDTWPDGTSDWINYLNLDGDNIVVSDINVTDLIANAENNSIIIEPFGNCRDFYVSEWKKYKELYGLPVPDDLPDEMIPLGCNVDEDSPYANYPFVVEKNSVAGAEIAAWLADNSEDTFLLAMVWKGVVDTFQKMIGCMDTEMVNPMIDPQKFPYPAWVWVEDPDIISFDFEWEDFNFGANIKNADLNIYDHGLTARVPLTIGVDVVSMHSVNRLLRNINLSEFDFNSPKKQPNFSSFTQANKTGHLVRSFDNLNPDKYPETRDTAAYAGLSINIEEIVNAALYLVFKKGPMSLLDTLDIEEVEASDNWTVGVDKVVLGRFDMCDLAGLMSSDLPSNILFASIQSIFEYPALHLDIILDPDYPPTLSLNEIEGVENATNIQVGLTNLQIALKVMVPHATGDGTNATVVPNVYERPDDQEEILRVRLDAVLNLKTVYYASNRTLKIFVEGYEKQNVHLSVPEGHAGPIYNDLDIVSDILNNVLPAVFQILKKDFNPAEDGVATIEVILDGEGSSLSVANIVNFEMNLNMDETPNSSCGDNIPYYADEVNAVSSFDPSNAQIAPIGDLSDALNGFDNDSENDSMAGSLASMEAMPMEMEPCDFIAQMGDNPIREALCDLGIEDVMLENPSLEFDNDTGYIHVSTELGIILHSWFGE